MKRKWFQYSLRSLVLLMLTAGAAVTLWRNFAPWTLERVLEGHTKDVNFAAFSPDGKYVVTQSDDDTVRVWDAQTGETRLKVNSDLKGISRSIFSPDSKSVVIAEKVNAEDSDGLYPASICDIKTGQKRILEKSPLRCCYALFSPDGRFVAIVRDHSELIGNLQIRNADDGVLRWSNGKSDPKLFARFSPDSKRIVTISEAHKAVLWNADDGDRGGLIDEMGNDDDEHAIFSPDSRSVAIVVDTGVLICDVESRRVKRVLKNRGSIRVLAYSPDGKNIASGDDPEVWDVESGTKLFELKCDKAVETLEYSPDGRLIQTAWSDGAVRIWDAKTGLQCAEFFENTHKKYLNDSEFSPDGQRIVTASHDETAQIWQRRRPEAWWGVAWLPEFWMAIVFAVALIWSVRRDRVAETKRI